MLDFSIEDEVAVLQIDDGKANAVSHAYIDALEAALERARGEASAVLIAGRPGLFSAGFDLKELQKGESERQALVNRGGHLLLRVFEHPQPVVVACTGHAMAAGALLTLAADSRIGARGDFKIGLNETAIGMALPVFGLELATHRINPRHLVTAVTQAQLYDPDGAAQVGFLDEVLAPEEVLDRARAVAAQLAELPSEAYIANKMGLRQAAADRIRASLD